MRRSFRALGLSIGVLSLVASSARVRADINGFGDFSQFTVNQGDSASSPTISTGIIHLTGQANFERRSIFANAPQSISKFTASFSYLVTNDGGNDGAAFVLQNSPAGVNALGSNASDLGYGTGGGLAGITNSAAVSLELNSSTASGFFTGGNIPGGSPLTGSVNLRSGDLIDVTLTYDGSTLQEQLVDTVTSASYGASFLVNLPSIVGGSTAFVGITASTFSDSNQTFSNFQFQSSVPEPGSLALMAVGIVGLVARRRR